MGRVHIGQGGALVNPHWHKSAMCGIFPTVTLRDRLRTRMLARGFEATSLANAAGVKVSFVRDILAGRSHNPHVEQLARVAAALHCGVEDLSRPQPRPDATPSHDPRTLALAELNAKLRSMSVTEIEIVSRLVDALHPRRKNNAA